MTPSNPLPKVLIFIVSYNAEAFIGSVLQRIPKNIWKNDKFAVEILVIDDHSGDGTFDKVAEFIAEHPGKKITLLFNPKNQGYGGNQKLGYCYAIRHGFDLVVLLHGDGQYAPEFLENMIDPILTGRADVVFGSRMRNRWDALRGKMPLYKWLGNLTLTSLQNRILNTHLSEFHTGYRAYRISALENIPFERNSNYFDFDTDIIIQMVDTGQRIDEISIPTYYGDEISHVNGLKYGALILLTTLRSRIVHLNLFYDPRFDYARTVNEQYTLKTGYPSSHQYALDQIKPEMMILDLGSGPGYMAAEISKINARVVSVDTHITAKTRENSFETLETDVEQVHFQDLQPHFDLVLLLDIIEHLHSPEELLSKIRQAFGLANPPKVILTTGNIGFLLIRMGLLIGQFNYGKRGILDLDHKRLFTFSSMRRLLEASGYEILKIKGLPAPFPEALGMNFVTKALLVINRVLIRISRGMFSYQMAFVARPLPMIEHLLEQAHHIPPPPVIPKEPLMIKENGP